ncbi:N-acetylneuraminate synthase [Silvanigrella aquatica]|uniref:N-acetylneuraminate synthase n=1 Tax=Silvanigrella aquatica TaxID=1915309 RepID=A0A1L4D2Z2_9BACT|nr:N-acetylneuraminate synthase [Silvanigrella aquatica]APJ04561.1 N-acetylneuraminate synthase [Silvanigrella aquatica]
MNNDKVTIIAEAGVNHNGSIEQAFKLIDVAAEAGADIVKFQTFSADNLVIKSAKKAEYQIKNIGNSETQYEMLKKLELTYDQFYLLKQHCINKNIEFLSTPFDESSLHFLVRDLNINYIKVPSGEITNYPFLLKMSKMGLPLIVSSGMTSLGEIETALAVIAFGLLGKSDRPSLDNFMDAFYSEEGQSILNKKVTLLHCTSEYPVPFNEVNLNSMKTLKASFSLNIGLSDHSEGISVPIAATALGATIIEKHFTLDKNLPGPDHKASLDPVELKEMVKSIREVEKSLGHGRKIPSQSELKNRKIVRKVLVASKEITKGDFFSEHNVCMKRAGFGMSSMNYWDLIGSSAQKDFCEDEIIQ